jgi:hypothetical protein
MLLLSLPSRYFLLICVLSVPYSPPIFTLFERYFHVISTLFPRYSLAISASPNDIKKDYFFSLHDATTKSKEKAQALLISHHQYR